MIHISERAAGNVTILAVRGAMTYSNYGVLSKNVRSLRGRGASNLVLDLADVPYCDSSGGGEIVGLYSTVSRDGGRLVLSRLNARVIAFLSITKLVTLFDIYDTVEEAVASFAVPPLDISCPVCRPRGWMAWSRNRLLGCPFCDVRFSVTLSDLDVGRAIAPSGATTRVTYLWWQTYYENGFGPEQVQLKLGRPSMVTVSGRLDLFVFDVILRAWEAVPTPRRVILDTTGVRFYSPAATERILELCDRARWHESRSRPPPTARRGSAIAGCRTVDWPRGLHSSERRHRRARAPSRCFAVDRRRGPSPAAVTS